MKRIMTFLGRRKFAAVFSAVLIAFTGYALLDTFVIPRNYAITEGKTETITEGTTETDEGEVEVGVETKVEAEAETEVPTATTVNLEEYRVNDTTVYVADVVMGSGDEIKTAFAQGVYGKNVKAKTSSIAESVDATLAINGDFYGARERGYVIRNGILYRNTSSGSEDLVIYRDGSWEIINENEITAEELLNNGALQVLSFGPALVESGEIAVTEGEEVGKAMASNPRTAIGTISENHYLFVVSDGRTSESEGLSLRELAEFMKELGAVTAYNLDGGGSSTMVFNGQVVNNPTTSGNSTKERSVSDIVYI